MSRAFVKENDMEHAGIDIPERPISTEVNYITPNGLKQLKNILDTLDAERQTLMLLDDSMSKQKKMRIERDIRYYASRIKTAILKKCPALKTITVMILKVLPNNNRLKLSMT